MKIVATVISLALLSGCSTPAPSLLRMRSLSEPIVLPDADALHPPSNGKIFGLANLPRDADGRIRANVLFVHGIGWTQDKNKLDFGRDFVNAVVATFGGEAPSDVAPSLCPRSAFASAVEIDSKPVGGKAGLFITDPAGYHAYFTDYSKNRSLGSEIACMDKQVVDLGARGSITVYRVIWDDVLYNAYQYPEIGYDDAFPKGGTIPLGREDIDSRRTEENRELKTSVVTYGLNDAAMYFGPIGSAMRLAVASALCIAIDDASGKSSALRDMISSTEKRQVSAKQACTASSGTLKPSFALIAESLGSRIVFDVLTGPDVDSAFPGSGSEAVRKMAMAKIGDISNERLEVFFLANQIPLFGTGRLSIQPRRADPAKPVRLVAVSEINDVLTYELVPYFEHLYFERCRNSKNFPQEAEGDCAGKTSDDLAASLMGSGKLRSALLADLGFEDVTDVRVRFAHPVTSFKPGFINPLEAHTKHMTIPFIRNLVLCGAQSGQVNGCAEKR